MGDASVDSPENLEEANWYGAELDFYDDSPFEVPLRDDVMPLVLRSCGGCHTGIGASFPLEVANEVFYEKEEDLLELEGGRLLETQPIVGFWAFSTKVWRLSRGLH